MFSALVAIAVLLTDSANGNINVDAVDGSLHIHMHTKTKCLKMYDALVAVNTRFSNCT